MPMGPLTAAMISSYIVKTFGELRSSNPGVWEDYRSTSTHGDHQWN